MTDAPLILAIESSCDDTAAALVQGRDVLSSVVSSQGVHADYGGIVPELASRAHQKNIVPVVEGALRAANRTLDDVGAVAVTYGPGLAGSLLVGLTFAKGLCVGRGLPLVGVNHLEGHVYSVYAPAATGSDARMPPAFPYLCLIVSGGHTELVKVDGGFEHRVLGRTRDDAAGEAFDKVAGLLGLDFPGGPAIDRVAREGDPSYHRFPRARLDGFDYSFSGIKTSMLYLLGKHEESERAVYLDRHRADLCASFQEAVVDMLVAPLARALAEHPVEDLAITGGVSANSRLRNRALEWAAEHDVRLHLPAAEYSVDNAAMIGITAGFKLAAQQTSPLTLTVDPSAALS